MRNISIVIPCETANDLPKSTNGFRDMRHVMWQRQKWQNKIKRHVIWPGPPMKRAKVTCLRHSSRQQDFDNLVNSFKFLIDAIVKCGILIDDAPEIIGQPDYQWVKANKGEFKIVIHISEVEDEKDIRDHGAPGKR